MIALFVTTAARDCGPAADRLGGLPEREIERGHRPGELVRARVLAQELREAVVPVGAVPEEPLDPLEERRREAAEALLGAELEGRVRLEAARLGAPQVAGDRERRDLLQQRRDDVEVGLGRAGLPVVRVDVVQCRGGGLREGLDLAGVGHRGAALRVAEPGVEPGERALDGAGGREVAGGEVGLELAEGDGGAVAERDRLLDLDRHDDAAVRDSPSVLDGHEPEVADQLAGTARLLRGRQRCRAEREQVVLDRGCRRGGRRRLARPGGADEALEGAIELRCGGLAALAGERAAEDPPVAASRRRRPGRLLGEPGTERVAGVGERRAQERLVRVEKVAADRAHGTRAGDDAVRERGDRDARRGARVREAGDGLELADEEPLPGPVEVACARRGENRLVCAGERCRPRGRCLHREVDAAPLRRDGAGRAAEAHGARARGGGEAVRKLPRRGGRPAACRRERAGVVRHRSELGVEERRVEGVELLPRRAFVRCGGRAGPQGRDERDDGEGEERSASRPLSAASQFPHPVSVRPAPRLRPGARCRGRLRPARSVPRSRSRAAGPGRPAGLPASA